MNILVVQTGFLGDVILSTPVLTNIRSLYQDAKLSVVTTPQAAELVEGLADEVIAFDKRGKDAGLSGLRNFAAQLRGRSFDLVFSLHKSWRTALLLKLAQIPVRYGFRGAAGSFLYSRTAPRSDQKHDVLRNLAILRNVGHAPESLPGSVSIRWKPEVEARVDQFIADIARPIIGLAPGSVWATKRWTEEGFSEVARRLKERGYSILLVGGKGDADIAARIEKAATVQNAVGKLSLIESACLISKLRLLITNDSAPLHLASAAKTPIVAIFCATVPEFGFGPWQVPSECVGLDDLRCRPCRRHGGPTCPTGTHACQRGVTPAMVLAAFDRVLQMSEKTPSISSAP